MTIISNVHLEPLKEFKGQTLLTLTQQFGLASKIDPTTFEL